MRQPETINVTHAKAALEQLLADVQSKGNSYIIETDGQATAVMISIEQHDRYLQSRSADFRYVEQLRARLQDDDSLEADIQEAANQVRHRL